MINIWWKYIETSLIMKITIALILGILVGFIFGKEAAILSPFGDLLLRLLQFLIIPLILFTLIVGLNQTKIGDLGRMGGKVFAYYTVTSAIAIIIGIAVASFLKPGTGMKLNTTATVDVPENPGIIQVLLQIVPDNIITAFSELNLLEIIFIAFAFGIAISSIRSSEKYAQAGEAIYTVIIGLNEATFRIMKAILQYVPIGVFAIMANTVGSQGRETLLSLGEVIIVLYLALLLQLVIYVILLLAVGISPKQFLRAARTPMITAFVTQSSNGTLPLTMTAARQLHLSKSLYSFSLPLGATINMDGAAIRIAVSAVFAANIVGDPLQFSEMLQVVLIGTLASIGTAGVPGAGIIMIATVFAQLDLPMEAVGLLTAIDVLIGMGCTCINVTGDLAGTCFIQQSEQRREKKRKKL